MTLSDRKKLTSNKVKHYRNYLPAYCCCTMCPGV